MMKHEFEKRIGNEISDKVYETVELVYNWHPAIDAIKGKDQMATIYKTGGVTLINEMVETARMMESLDGERRALVLKMEELGRREELIARGDLSEERCRSDVERMLDESESPEQWYLAKAFLKSKYGEELTYRIIKEVEA